MKLRIGKYELAFTSRNSCPTCGDYVADKFYHKCKKEDETWDARKAVKEFLAKP